jgi:hypothetical protein
MSEALPKDDFGAQFDGELFGGVTSLFALCRPLDLRQSVAR